MSTRMTDTAQCPHFLIGRVLNKAEATAPVVLEKTFAFERPRCTSGGGGLCTWNYPIVYFAVYIYTVLYNVELFGSLKDFSCSSLSS